MTTTAQITARDRRLKLYETLEIKRRFPGGYESSWYDVTDLLLDSTGTSIQQRLDWSGFGYGQFETSSANFIVDNTQGEFSEPERNYSLFSGTITRHYTQIRYKAGYKDETGSNIDETVFTGLLNEKTAKTNFETGEVVFSALSFESILTEQTIAENSLTPRQSVSDLIGELMNDAYIQSFIGYDAGKVNPGYDFTFDDATYYETKKISEALDEICQKSNSVWYVDSSLDLVVRNRGNGTNTPHEFVGGNRQQRSVNIERIVNIDAGHQKLINEVTYDSDGTLYQFRAPGQVLERDGIQTLELSGRDVTDKTVIETIADTILTEWQMNRRRIRLTTPYWPNVVGLFDLCTVDYQPKNRDLGSLPILVWNSGSWNNGEYYAIPQNRMILTAGEASYVSYGWRHNVPRGTTEHFLIKAK